MLLWLWGGAMGQWEKRMRKHLDEARQEERQKLEMIKQKTEEPTVPPAFAESNWAVHASEGHLGASPFPDEEMGVRGRQ